MEVGWLFSSHVMLTRVGKVMFPKLAVMLAHLGTVLFPKLSIYFHI
jgi:hypothetical protein